MRAPPAEIPEAERDYYLERKYPSFGNLSPRDIASRAAKEVCDEGRGVGPGGRGVYLDFADAIKRLGERHDRASATATCSRCTSASRARIRTRCRCASIPAVHYTMGGLWVDYNLMSTIPGLHVIGEANFSDHGANRLGASALMQGLADGYFILPYTIGDYLASDEAREPVDALDTPAFREAEAAVAARTKQLARDRRASARWTSFHRELGKIMWEYCGMARTRGRPHDGARADPGAARGVLAAT